MKRYQHYKRDRAIVLSCFGSVIEQDTYFGLKSYVEKEFEDSDVFIAFSSRMVLKLLTKEGKEYKNLPQTLADVDMLGYKNIIVASINLFPTDEHEFLKNIVEGFKKFSLANIRLSDAIMTKTNWTTKFLKSLNQTISKDSVANLYVIHGTPRLDMRGIDSVTYSANLLEMMGRNYCCSLEGAYPWCDIKEFIIQKMKDDVVQKVQVVPMLLVSGNHYIKDMIEIKDELSKDFESFMALSITKSDKFNLLEMDDVQELICKNISQEIKKLG